MAVYISYEFMFKNVTQCTIADVIRGFIFNC